MNNALAAVLLGVALLAGVGLFLLLAGPPGQTDPEASAPRFLISSTDSGPYPSTPVLDVEKTRSLHPGLDRQFRKALDDGAASEGNQLVFQPYWEFILSEVGQDPATAAAMLVAYDGHAFVTEITEAV